MDVKKINFRQPKYLLPAILYFPILFVGYFVIDMFQTDVSSNKTDPRLKTTDYLSGDLPEANTDSLLGDKMNNTEREFGQISDLRHLPLLVLYHAQRMGHGRHHPLPVRYADVLHRIYHLPRYLCMEQVEGATAQMGSCRHLLAHCRFLLSYHPDCDARTRLLGMEPLYLHLGMRHSRHGDELCQTQGPQ